VSEEQIVSTADPHARTPTRYLAVLFGIWAAPRHCRLDVEPQQHLWLLARSKDGHEDKLAVSPCDR
jgi:hypothetical protein